MDVFAERYWSKKTNTKTYKKEGYRLIDENNKVQLLFSYNNYFEQLISDITEVKKVVFMINYKNDKRLTELLSYNDNVQIISDLDIAYHNITVNHSDLNVVVIDDEILWYGSINPFTYPSKEDTILRISDKEYVEEII